MVVQVLQLGEFCTQDGLFQVQESQGYGRCDPTPENDESPEENESSPNDGVPQGQIPATFRDVPQRAESPHDAGSLPTTNVPRPV